MKTVGLIGGMSWESTVPYYRTINRVIGDRLGGLHSAKMAVYSVDFHEIEELQQAARWTEAGTILVAAARAVQRAGADFLVLCTNTMHKVAPRLEAEVDLPLLHIADATAMRVKTAGLRRMGLLGTRFTMEEEFYRGRLERRHGLEILVPAAEPRAAVHRIIYDELCRGRVLEESRVLYQEAVSGLIDREPRASFWAAPRLDYCSVRRMPTSRCSTLPRSMQRRRLDTPSRRSGAAEQWDEADKA